MITFFLEHLVWFVPIGALAIIVVAMALLPGASAAILAFLRTTIGKVIVACIVSGFLGYWVCSRIDGAAMERAEAAHAEALLDQAKIDAENTSKIEDAAADRERDSDRLTKTLQNRLDDYDKKLAASKTPRCALGDDDVRSLRGIAGLTARPAKRPR